MRLDPITLERFWAKVNKTDSCWLWTANHLPRGYGKVTIARKEYYTHRLSYMMHHGPIPPGMLVLHNCPGGDNPACVNPAHLRLGTYADNNRDTREKGRHTTARLTADNVREIRRRAAAGEKFNPLSREYGVCFMTIKNIVLGVKWRDV